MPKNNIAFKTFDYKEIVKWLESKGEIEIPTLGYRSSGMVSAQDGTIKTRNRNGFEFQITEEQWNRMKAIADAHPSDNYRTMYYNAERGNKCNPMVPAICRFYCFEKGIIKKPE